VQDGIRHSRQLLAQPFEDGRGRRNFRPEARGDHNGRKRLHVYDGSLHTIMRTVRNIKHY
jgi:hypothetical protein